MLGLQIFHQSFCMSSFGVLNSLITCFTLIRYDLSKETWIQLSIAFGIIQTVGTVLGLIFGSVLMMKNRIYLIRAVFIIQIVSNSIFQIDNIWGFIIGRALSCIAIGMNDIAVKRISEEYSPMQSF